MVLGYGVWIRFSRSMGDGVSITVKKARLLRNFWYLRLGKAVLEADYRFGAASVFAERRLAG